MCEAGWGPVVCVPGPGGGAFLSLASGPPRGRMQVPRGGSPSQVPLSCDLQASSSRQDSLTLPTSGPSPAWSDSQTTAPAAPEAESSYLGPAQGHLSEGLRGQKPGSAGICPLATSFQPRWEPAWPPGSGCGQRGRLESLMGGPHWSPD